MTKKRFDEIDNWLEQDDNASISKEDLVSYCKELSRRFYKVQDLLKTKNTISDLSQTFLSET